MPCVFCERDFGPNRKRSGEHLWPKWMRALLPRELLEGTIRYAMETGEDGVIREAHLPLFEMEVKNVCEPCNRGWMEAHEANMQRLIKGMLVGRGRILYPPQQTQIAARATMKSLVFHRAFRRREMAPREHYREVYALRDAQHPPSKVRVYTAAAGWSTGRAQGGFYRANGVVMRGSGKAVPEYESDGYLVTTSYLNLVVQVFWPFGDESDFIHGKGLAPSIRRLWPPSDTFDWPPGPALTQAGIEALAGGGPGPPPRPS